MKAKVNGIEVPVTTGIDIEIVADPAGEILPRLTITASGGPVDVYRSHVEMAGTIRFHLFGAGEEKDAIL